MKIWHELLLFILVLVSSGFTQNITQYCRLCSDHTLCKYKGVGTSCSPRLASGVTDKERALIVKLHNDLRQMVANGQEVRGLPGPQPSAANMRLMSWDTELASVAQQLANQCTFNHDTCRNVPRFTVGQNLAWLWGLPNSNWSWAIHSWYDEVTLYNKQHVDILNMDASTGHYTQLVWADTYLIGCGYIKYNTKGSTIPEHIFVCNYGPAGNYLRQALYKRGPAASKCAAKTASGRSKGYPGLCS